MRDLKIPLIFCHVEKDNRATIGLLKKLGFEIRDTHHLMDLGYKPRT